MWDIPRNYVSACSNSVQLMPLQPIIISNLFHHYKELRECLAEVEQIEAKVNNKHRRLTVIEEEEQDAPRKKNKTRLDWIVILFISNS